MSRHPSRSRSGPAPRAGEAVASAQPAGASGRLFGRALIGVYALSGLTSLGYEVLWARVLALQFGVSIFSVVAVVVAFMGGLGAGSLVGIRAAARAPRPLRIFALLEAGIALFATPCRGRSRPRTGFCPRSPPARRWSSGNCFWVARVTSMTLAEMIMASVRGAVPQGRAPVAALDRMLEIRPDYAAALGERWSVEMQNGRPAIANQYLARLRRVSPLDPAVTGGRGTR